MLSPDGTRSAIVFVRNCGATAGHSINVSVLNADNDLPNQPGNAFVADDDHGRARLGTLNAPFVGVEWTNNQNLVVTHDVNARVFKAVGDIAETQVVYRSSVITDVQVSPK